MNYELCIEGVVDDRVVGALGLTVDEDYHYAADDSADDTPSHSSHVECVVGRKRISCRSHGN